MVTETMSRRGATSTANLMALTCVADSKLGKFGEGRSPVTRTGDYSDVMVVDADGRLIPWQRVARLDADEMRATMREIADRLYTFLLNLESAELAALSDHRRQDTRDWDRPREDPGLKKQMDVLASGGGRGRKGTGGVAERDGGLSTSQSIMRPTRIRELTLWSLRSHSRQNRQDAQPSARRVRETSIDAPSRGR